MGTVQQDKAPSPKQLFISQPNPLAPQSAEIESYVNCVQLRYRSSKDSSERARLRREALSQIELAGIRSASNRSEALDSLSRIFRLGLAPTSPLDGFYRGIMVAPALHPYLDQVLRLTCSIYMPWMGKRFNAADTSGDNLIAQSGKTAARIVWPGYKGIAPAEDGLLSGFQFRTYTSPGRMDHDRRVLTLDYQIEENPSFIISNITDELVEVVPGVYLGKMLHRRGGSFKLTAYFAVTDLPKP